MISIDARNKYGRRIGFQYREGMKREDIMAWAQQNEMEEPEKFADSMINLGQRYADILAKTKAKAAAASQ
jgi:hypothetical protein